MIFCPSQVVFVSTWYCANNLYCAQSYLELKSQVVFASAFYCANNLYCALHYVQILLTILIWKCIELEFFGATRL